MRIAAVNGTGIGRASTPRRSTDEQSAPETQSRALIAVEAPVPSDRTGSRHHPGAPFLAQLIATALLAPQTRARRRAEPAEAIAAYRVNQISLSEMTGHGLRRNA